MPVADQRIHGHGCLRRRDGAESHPLGAVAPFLRSALDNVTVVRLVLPRIPDLAAGQGVQPADGLVADREICRVPVDQGQGVAVAPHLLFIPVQEQGTRGHQDLANPFRVDRDPLDSVRRDGALDDRRLTQCLQALWRLLGVERLFAAQLAQIARVPGGARPDTESIEWKQAKRRDHERGHRCPTHRSMLMKPIPRVARLLSIAQGARVSGLYILR